MEKIIQDYKGCIGCGTCAALCPKFWEMEKGEMKARPKGGKKNEETGEYELEVENMGCNRDAADACPVQAIKIVCV